jgi:hypothetical protein
MTFASETQVRSLMGLKTIYDEDGDDITDDVVSDAIIRGDSRVKGETGVSTWDTGDALYGMVQEAAEYFAASYILTRYGKNENEINKEAMDYYMLALDICYTIAKSSTQAVYVSSKAYKSYPINPDGSIHRSLNGSGDVGTLSGS